MKRIYRKIIVSLLILTLIGGGGVSCSTPKSVVDTIKEYALTHEQFTLGEILDFEWDVAYQDVLHYAHAEFIKEKYGLDFEAELSETDDTTRWFFFKDNVLVETITFYYSNEMYTSNALEQFFPDTVFTAKWIDGRLHLSASNDIAIESPLSTNNQSISDYLQTVQANPTAQMYLNYLHNTDAIMSLVQIDMIVAAAETLPAFGYEIAFTFYLYLYRYGEENNYVASTKIYVSCAKNTITRIETYTGLDDFLPIDTTSPILYPAQALKLTAGDIYDLANDAAGESLEQDMQVTIKNDTVDIMQCMILGTDNTLPLEFGWCFDGEWKIA